jgi:hypothetical protein
MGRGIGIIGVTAALLNSVLGVAPANAAIPNCAGWATPNEQMGADFPGAGAGARAVVRVQQDDICTQSPPSGGAASSASVLFAGLNQSGGLAQFAQVGYSHITQANCLPTPCVQGPDGIYFHEFLNNETGSDVVKYGSPTGTPPDGQDRTFKVWLNTSSKPAVTQCDNQNANCAATVTAGWTWDTGLSTDARYISGESWQPQTDLPGTSTNKARVGSMMYFTQVGGAWADANGWTAYQAIDAGWGGQLCAAFHQDVNSGSVDSYTQPIHDPGRSTLCFV